MPILIIAEIGSVHNGDFAFAKQLIELCKECGADIAKFQTHIAEAETLENAPNPPYFTGEPRYEYFKRTGFSPEQWKELKEHCDAVGIEFMSSPFSVEAVELLDGLGMKRFKIPSGEVTNLPMLEVIASKKKPVLLSSGMSTWEELDAAVATIRAVHNNITVLQCTSEYPCPPERVGLNIITEMALRYKLPVGFSDHTRENYAPFAAVMLGVSVIEKHITTSRSLYGSDAKNALEPEEFKDLVNGVRAIEAMQALPLSMDDVTKNLAGMKGIFEKSIVTLRPIAAGAALTAADIGIKKPGTGIPARFYKELIGKRVSRAIEGDMLLPADAVDGWSQTGRT